MRTDVEKYHEWQYFIPEVEAGLVEISNPIGLRADKSHVRRLLEISLNRSRLPPGTIIVPYYSLDAVLLRERAITECIPVNDIFQVGSVEQIQYVKDKMMLWQRLHKENR